MPPFCRFSRIYTECFTYNRLKVYLGCFLSRKRNTAKMTITEIRCAHLLCLSSKAARIFFLIRCRNVDAYMAADILNNGSAGARWFINQSQIHFAPLIESKRISEYMNTKSVDPGAIPRRFVDKAVSCDDTTKRSSRPGV